MNNLVRTQENITDFMTRINAPSKEDFLVDAPDITMEGLSIKFDNQTFETTGEFRNQMYSNLAPGLGTYARHLEGKGDLSAINENVNRLLQRRKDSRLVRTIDGSARGFLSDRFLALDNDVVFGKIEGRLAGNTEFNFLKSHVGHNSASVKMISVEKFLDLGARSIHFGFMIENSEIGRGFCRFVTFLCDSFCKNGILFGKREVASVKFMHKGAQLSGLGRVKLGLDSEKLTLVGEELDNAMQEACTIIPSQGLKDKLIFSYEKQIEGDMRRATEELVKRFSIPISAEVISMNMEPDANKSIYSLQGAITHYAKSAETYEERLRLEEIAGSMIEQAPALYPILNEVSK